MLTGRKRLLLVREEAGIKVETVVAAPPSSRTPYDSFNPTLPPSSLTDTLVNVIPGRSCSGRILKASLKNNTINCFLLSCFKALLISRVDILRMLFDVQTPVNWRENLIFDFFCHLDILISWKTLEGNIPNGISTSIIISICVFYTLCFQKYINV